MVLVSFWRNPDPDPYRLKRIRNTDFNCTNFGYCSPPPPHLPLDTRQPLVAPPVVKILKN